MKYPVLTLLIAVLLLAGCAPAVPSPGKTIPQPTPASTDVSAAAGSSSDQIMKSEDFSRTDSQGAVTVEVTPLNLDNPDDTLQFDVSMNTHSVDLSMDLATLATLTTSTGITVQATLWDGPKGGHHVEGKLSFPASQNGKSILDGTELLTLTIKGVDAPERTFTWELPAK